MCFRTVQCRRPRCPRLLRWFLPVLLCGCAAARPPDALPEAQPWQSPYHRDHPLVGRIFDVRRDRYIDEDALVAALAKRPVLLGEKHDNPDHHRLQARMIRRLAARRPCRAVVFEMIDDDGQQHLDEHLRRSRARGQAPGQGQGVVTGIAAALRWDHSGWPDFALYRPVFSAAYRQCDALLAGGLGRELSARLSRSGMSALDPAFVKQLKLQEPLPKSMHRAMREEMKTAHCGMLPQAMLDPMVQVQRARDAKMAQVIHRAGGPGVVLVAGSGHVRRDRGVPYHLLHTLQQPSRALAFVEVEPKLKGPKDVAHAFGMKKPPYDFMWFTPAAHDATDDPCSQLHPSMARRGTRSRKDAEAKRDPSP